MPIHIIRDVALTIRSFYKRITDFVRYRQATRDMNARYPDATTEEVAREDVCIICREEMRPWSQPPPQNGQPAQNQANNATTANPVDERSRPKKLPCGHILHFACLRSWLERQQNCPTCRRPVLVSDPVVRIQTPQAQHQQARGQPQRNPTPPQLPDQAGQVGQAGQAGQNPFPPQNVFHFGPLRIAFGARQLPQRAQQNNVAPVPTQQGALPTIDTLPHNGDSTLRHGQQTNSNSMTASTQLQQIEQQLMREIDGLRLQHDHLYLVRALQGELTRLRLSQMNSGQVPTAPASSSSHHAAPISIVQPGGPLFASDQLPQTPSTEHQLPTGMTIPEGWTVVPLRRLSGNTDVSFGETQSSRDRPTRTEVHVSTTTPPQPPDPPETNTVQGRTLAAEPTNIVSPAGPRNDVSSTRQPSVSPMDRDIRDEVAKDTYRRKVEPPTGDPSPTIRRLPNWSSDPTISEAESAMNGMESKSGSTATDVETRAPAGNGESEPRDKGKGKATTIEDSNENRH